MGHRGYHSPASKSKGPNSIEKIGRGYLYLIDIDLNFDKQFFFYIIHELQISNKNLSNKPCQSGNTDYWANDILGDP
jgi:hypothetical protein